MRREELIAERYDLALSRIREIPNESICGEAYREYFTQMAEFVKMMDQTLAFVEDGSLFRASMEELQERNHLLYEDILPEQYDKSYANPDYAVSRLGESIGRALSFLYGELRSMIPAAYEKNRASMAVRMELLLEVYQSFVCAAQEHAEPEAEALRQIFLLVCERLL